MCAIEDARDSMASISDCEWRRQGGAYLLRAQGVGAQGGLPQHCRPVYRGRSGQSGRRADAGEERERRLTAGEMRGYRRVKASLSDILASLVVRESSACTGLSLPTTSRRVSVEVERKPQEMENLDRSGPHSASITRKLTRKLGQLADSSPRHSANRAVLLLASAVQGTVYVSS